MFGYRLVRTDEFDELRSHRQRVLTLLEQIGELKGQLGTRTAMVDLLTMRVNVLEQNAALREHAATGQPVAVAQIGKGSPTVNARLGAGTDLFEDVGDDEADRLKQLGMLHDDDGDFTMPAAAELAKQV